MKLTLLTASLALFSHFSFAQYCVSGGPSTTADSNLEQLSITGSSGSINFTGCPAVTGVQHHNTETVSLAAGDSYVLNVKFGTCGGNFPSVGEAWIDYNGNFIFEANESVLTWSGSPPVAATGYVITVPGTALAGLRRMRVMQAESSTLPLDPCAAFTWGSTTDFNVNITGGVDCSSYVGDDRFDARLVPAIPFAESHSTAVCYSDQSYAYSSPDVFYKIVPGSSGALKVSLCGSSFDTFLSIQDQNGMAIYGNDDAQNCGTSSEIEFLTDGLDTVYAVVEGWGLASGDYTITITESSVGLNDLEADNLFVYPNPTQGVVHFNQTLSGTFNVYAIDGQLVHQKDIHQCDQLDLSNLPKGIYWIEVVNNDHRLTQKISIQ